MFCFKPIYFKAEACRWMDLKKTETWNWKAVGRAMHDLTPFPIPVSRCMSDSLFTLQTRFSLLLKMPDKIWPPMENMITSCFLGLDSLLVFLSQHYVIFNPYKNPSRLKLFFLHYIWGNWSWERLWLPKSLSSVGDSKMKSKSPALMDFIVQWWNRYSQINHYRFLRDLP